MSKKKCGCHNQCSHKNEDLRDQSRTITIQEFDDGPEEARPTKEAHDDEVVELFFVVEKNGKTILKKKIKNLLPD